MPDGVRTQQVETATPDETVATHVDRTGRLTDALILCLALMAVVLAVIFRVMPDQRVEWSSGNPLPPTCMTRALFDMNCPACGLTRSFVHLADGDLLRSFGANRVGWLLAALVLLQIPLRIAVLSGRVQPRHPLVEWQSLALLAIAALLVVNWAINFATA